MPHVPAGELRDQPQTHGRSHEGDEPGDHVEGDRVTHGQTGGGEHLGRVVHGRVDTGELVSQAQDDADEQQVAGPLDAHDLGQAPLLLVGLLAADLDHLVDLLGHRTILVLVTHALEGADGLRDPLVGDVPARGLRHEADTDPQGDGGKGGQDEHVTPGHAVAASDGGEVDGALDGVPLLLALDALNLDGRTTMVLGEPGVHGECEELTEDDHHLVHSHQGAADALGSGLTEEDGNGHRGTTDGEAQDDAEEVEDPDVRGERAPQGPDEEDQCENRDVVPASVLVGETASQRGP